MASYTTVRDSSEIQNMLNHWNFQENSILDICKKSNNANEVERLYKMYQKEVVSFFANNCIFLTIETLDIMFMQKFGGVTKSVQIS